MFGGQLLITKAEKGACLFKSGESLLAQEPCGIRGTVLGGPAPAFGDSRLLCRVSDPMKGKLSSHDGSVFVTIK